MLSKHFRRHELACKCKCSQNTVDAELITVLEDVRKHFGLPVVISSGNRCESYNRYVGGAEDSQHLYSKAADIAVKGVEPIEVYKYLVNKHIGKYGIGSYKTFTHIDVRAWSARW